MPFGRYRGWPLHTIPADYLSWLLTISLREPLASRVRAEHQRRQAPGRPALVEPAVAAELVTAGLHALTRRYHPDAGGDHTRMVQVNLAAEWLRAKVNGA